LNAKTWLVLGACLGGLAVALGAFGAHGLPKYYDLLDLSAGDDLRHKGLANWEIAARYHMVHALAMLGVGLMADRRRMLSLDVAGIAFFAGILVFSGCLYALALTGPKILGAIVPIGGVSFIIGWIFLALAANQFAASDAKPLPTLEQRLAAARKDVVEGEDIVEEAAGD
jgi:uncharacterized membrane protein YgdD (TMEM256/DUF423 family)